MKLNNLKITNKGVYIGLIITFIILYLCVGFVSTLHSITFFHLANSIGLSILLGLTYELGQASVLFGILTTKNKDQYLPWLLMILLTALQVTANVYASYRYMMTNGSNDWLYWQQSILFGVNASSPQMYQVIISWISGALLPIVALGMTALVANNIKLMNNEENESKLILEPPIITEQPIQSEEFNQQEKTDNINKEDISSDLDESKKVKESLLKEEIQIPKKRRFINPLTKKSKIKKITSSELNKLYHPSKGDEVIKMIENSQKNNDNNLLNTSIKDEPVSSNEKLEDLNHQIPYIENGVEVIDGKAISKNKRSLDKFRIPVNPDNIIDN
ncbi:hypothetical protein M0Q50_09100 [bacterium]|jgi:hypothetical protein|nr:hypothetical protein [bacterium]